MKHLVYVILLFGFFVAQAQDTVFNPVEQKAKVCQQYEDVKKTLSCEGEDCPPLYNSAVPFVLHFTASQMCSFECVVGERMCDETLHPDHENQGFLSVNENRARCSSSDDDVTNPERFISYDDDGVKYIEEVKTYSNGCEEWTEYVEICNGECREIELYSEEWYEYERQQQLKEYEKSCFVATENDCKNIDQEMNQCVLALTEQISEFFCAPSTGNLWRYRKYGAEGSMFGFARPMSFKSARRRYSDKDRTKPESLEYPAVIETEPSEEPSSNRD